MTRNHSYGTAGQIAIETVLTTVISKDFVELGGALQAATPLTFSDIIRRVLVPEVSLLLIARDSAGGNLDAAISLLLDSSPFGRIQYPEAASEHAVDLFRHQLVVKQREGFTSPPTKWNTLPVRDAAIEDIQHQIISRDYRHPSDIVPDSLDPLLFSNDPSLTFSDLDWSQYIRYPSSSPSKFL